MSELEKILKMDRQKRLLVRTIVNDYGVECAKASLIQAYQIKTLNDQCNGNAHHPVGTLQHS